MLRPLTVLCALLAPLTRAVFLDEAYKIDFHHPLLGLPLEPATFFQQPQPDSRASLIYTLSEKSVVGAVNPKDGTLVWRQALDGTESSRNALLRPGDGQEAVLGARNNIVTAWHAGNGRILWEQRLEQGLVLDIRWTQLPAQSSARLGNDILVLVRDSAGLVLKRLDGTSGKSTNRLSIKTQNANRSALELL